LEGWNISGKTSAQSKRRTICFPLKLRAAYEAKARSRWDSGKYTERLFCIGLYSGSWETHTKRPESFFSV